MQQLGSTDADTGLSAEAVIARREEGRVNIQPGGQGKTVPQIIRGRVFTFFNFINLVLAALILMVGSYKNLLFLNIVIINTLIGVIQELRAKKTLDKLALIAAPKVTVIRDAQEQTIALQELVTDDIMLLSSGRQVCADAVMVQGTLEADESWLTGEADAVYKKPGDTLYSGSFVVSGRARARVRRVGADNTIHQITAQAKAPKKHPSELRRAIDRILKMVSVIIVPLGAGLFCSQYYRSDASLHDAVVGCVAAMLGMIPEGLVLLTSIALAVGVIHLGRRRMLIHEMYGIETLARVDVLCLDKTGTLTESGMKVDSVQLLEAVPLDEIVGNLVRALPDDNATLQALTERFAPQTGYTVVSVMPFSSARKYSGAYFAEKGLYVLGAFESLFGRTSFTEARSQAELYARSGLRVLTLAHSPQAQSGGALPEDLAPCAFILLSDTLRPDARQTLSYFTEQGVTLYVLSGDHPATVAQIAARTGLPGAGQWIDASALHTPDEMREAIQTHRVFGRVSPSQKRELIRALKDAGHTVAMTGDGVNDVPALKEADCSIAMAQGSDAAKYCANLVLLDSQFAALPDAVAQGRRVIHNIQSAASLFLVKTVFSFVLTVLMLCFGTPYPFMPIHLTIIGACAVGVPTFLLSMEANNSPIRRGFLRHVMHNALTGALVIILMICGATLLAGAAGYTEQTRVTLCVILTGITSLYMIPQVYPARTWPRKIVCGGMFAAFWGGTLFLRDFLALGDLSYTPALLVVAAVIAIPHLIAGVFAGLGRVAGLWTQKWGSSL